MARKPQRIRCLVVSPGGGLDHRNLLEENGALISEQLRTAYDAPPIQARRFRQRFFYGGAYVGSGLVVLHREKDVPLDLLAGAENNWEGSEPWVGSSPSESLPDLRVPENDEEVPADAPQEAIEAAGNKTGLVYEPTAASEAALRRYRKRDGVLVKKTAEPDQIVPTDWARRVFLGGIAAGVFGGVFMLIVGALANA